MTSNKAQKRAVRARMAKTGERYSTARLYHLDLHREGEARVAEAPQSVEAAQADSTAPAAPKTLPPRVAEPGMSDESILRGSGRTWDEWFALLDAWHATERSHTEIARHVSGDLGVDGWWAQSVTVGYERARGMRAVNQRPDGYSVNASRTVGVPVERLYAAVVDRPSDLVRLRTARENRSARFDVLENGTILGVLFAARGPKKSTVTLQQAGLPNEEALQHWRATWKAYLDELAAELA